MGTRMLRTDGSDERARLRRDAACCFNALGVAVLLLAGCAEDPAASPATVAPGPAVMGPVGMAPTAQPMAQPPSMQPAVMMTTGGTAAPTQPSTPSAPPVQAPPMTPPSAMEPDPAPMDLPIETGTPTLFWLEIRSGQVWRANADGRDAKQIASGPPLSAPDGVAVDPMEGHVFVLNMGSTFGGANNASLVRYDLDGGNPKVLIPPGTKVGGVTFNTGKQVTLDRVNRKLYMADREGGKVWRADLEGQNLEILVSGHGIMQVVGVGVDPINKQFYFSDKPGHKIFRAGIEMPAGKTHADREDVELLYVDTKARIASSLDIELDIKARRIYWTDKDQYIVFGMSMDMPAGEDAMTRTDVDHVVSNMAGVIGLAFDHQEGMLYTTHSGSVSSFKTDGSMLKRIGSNGSTGISFVRIP